MCDVTITITNDDAYQLRVVLAIAHNNLMPIENDPSASGGELHHALQHCTVSWVNCNAGSMQPRPKSWRARTPIKPPKPNIGLLR
jgi:hypothetical protein